MKQYNCQWFYKNFPQKRKNPLTTEILFAIMVKTATIGGMTVKFALKELMARKERETGKPVTYERIRDTTGISLNTLSLIANNKIKRMPVDAIDDLLGFFDCTPNDFIIYVKD